MHLLLCITALFVISTTTEAAPYSGWGSSSSSSSSRESVRVGGPGPAFYLTPSPGVIIGGGTGLPGFNLQFGAKVVRRLPLHVTVDAGPYFYSGYYGFRVAVPILFGADYEFFIPGSNVSFVAGVNFGPVVSSAVTFGMLFRPGINVSLERGLDFSFEPRFGVIGGFFAFVPQLGIRFWI
jgi:hypothetical protein